MAEKTERSLKTAPELIGEAVNWSVAISSGELSSDAPVMILDKNSMIMSQIIDVRIEASEDTGQHTIWLVIEEY